jgi:predicted KAP-like P-loop ATPase
MLVFRRDDASLVLPMTAHTTVGADRPLVDPGEDVLGYAPFAKQLAHTLLRNSPADGFVIAIYGAWGTGKSTALNFVVHYMEEDADADAPIIVRFNPWWFAGSEDLTRRFFAQFESAVFAGRAKKRKLKSAFAKFASAVGEVPYAPVQATGKLAAAAVRATAVDVVKLKEELSGELAKEALRIVVIMDDIDRLVADEVRQLFRLIKAVADFPNVTYLLAFDRQVAANALGEVHEGRGEAYLEKIVQAPFVLPPPDRTQLQSLLLTRIGEVLGEIPDAQFDQVYWGNVFMDAVDPFVRKPRDIVRLVNALTVTFPAVKGEVNVVDFVALETLRVFCPVAYTL